MALEVQTFAINGPCLITPPVFKDARGWFRESHKASQFADVVGYEVNFVQDNESVSLQTGTLRGLHFQVPPHAQGKLVRVIAGEILDVAVDIRRDSPTYGQHISVTLDANTGAQFWVPEGFAHGFITRQPHTHVAYKCTAQYARESEDALLWNSPELNIDWGTDSPILSDKDALAALFADFTSPFKGAA